jgi:hypothetical protein
MATALSDTMAQAPMSALVSVATVGATGAAVGFGYGLAAGIVVAIARRMPLPGRAIVAAIVVFAIGISGLGDRVFSLLVADLSLPHLDPTLALLARAILAAVVAFIAWQEAGTPLPRTVAAVGQAGRAQRR